MWRHQPFPSLPLSVVGIAFQCLRCSEVRATALVNPLQELIVHVAGLLLPLKWEGEVKEPQRELHGFGGSIVLVAQGKLYLQVIL
jgi:hypothetical protein